jgi:hypothetical protein
MIGLWVVVVLILGCSIMLHDANLVKNSQRHVKNVSVLNCVCMCESGHCPTLVF